MGDLSLSGVQKTDYSYIPAGNSYDGGEYTSEPIFQTKSASTDLIGKMQAFFEGLETKEYDPRQPKFTDFDQSTNYWNA